MLVETLRIVKDHLEDRTWGLETMLRSLTVDPGELAPVTPWIADETRDINVALGRPTRQFPSLALTIDAVEDLDSRTAQQTRDCGVAVVFRYWMTNAQAADGTRDAYYTMRALERSLDALDRVGGSRNGITLYACTDRQYGGKVLTVDDAIVTIGLRAVFQVRETLS